VGRLEEEVEHDWLAGGGEAYCRLTGV
jgi:hypothetical protein